MTGTLKRLLPENRWIVEYEGEKAGENVWVNQLPLHPDSVLTIIGYLQENTKVEFEIVEEETAPEIGGLYKQYAKIKHPDKDVELVYSLPYSGQNVISILKAFDIKYGPKAISDKWYINFVKTWLEENIAKSRTDK